MHVLDFLTESQNTVTLIEIEPQTLSQQFGKFQEHTKETLAVESNFAVEL